MLIPVNTPSKTHHVRSFEDAIIGADAYLWLDDIVPGNPEILTEQKSDKSSADVLIEAQELMGNLQEKLSQSLCIETETSFSSAAEWALSLQVHWKNLYPHYEINEKMWMHKLQFAKILFLVDACLPALSVIVEGESQTNTDEELKELESFFAKDVAIMVQKMFRVLPLKPSDVFLTSIEVFPSELAKTDFFHWSQIPLVVPLGAKATQFLLGEETKLSLVHGRQFELPKNAQIPFRKALPLFHPNIFYVNQNMKKATWSDLQEVLRLLNSCYN
jgi:hypothetical protein